MIDFQAFGLPAPGGSKTTGVRKNGQRFVRDSSQRAAPWKAHVARAAVEAMGERPLLEGPLLLRVTFTIDRPLRHFGARGLRPSAPPRPIVRPDLTKLLRPVEDALTGIVWHDDAQVVVQLAEKRYGNPVGVHVVVQAYERDGDAHA